MDIQATIDRHERIALEFSGGRDSLACLFLMQPYWDRLTVYWCNAGDPFPETLATIARVRALVPNFVEIQGKQPEVIAQHGIPTDILPASRTPMGIVGSGNQAQPMQDRYSCCLRSVMLPMHERMFADGITLIIRGQKNADKLKGILRSGDVDAGIEFFYPIETWTTKEVMAFLRNQPIDVPRFYEMLNTAPDCMTCSGYWEEGVSAYLKRYHYPQYQIVQQRLEEINAAVSESIQHFNQEVGAATRAD